MDGPMAYKGVCVRVCVCVFVYVHAKCEHILSLSLSPLPAWVSTTKYTLGLQSIKVTFNS